MIKQIENYLKQNYINVPVEWIQACISFIESEHGHSSTVNLHWLQEKVHEQWLHADLTELGTCCLPFNLVKEKLRVLNGCYALQINNVKDIGVGAYSQLQKLRKDDVENTNISAEKSFTAAWEPKPSRMLMLQLTDGTTVVQGMEYKPINSLSLSMKPGAKILLKGKIETRRGILLLSSSNVTVLGGEVESLLVTNAPENILRRTLRLDESENPIPVPETFVPTATQSSLTQSQYYNTQPTQVNPFANTFIKTKPLPQSQSSFVNRSSSSVTNSEFDDDLDDFMDMETEMALLEAEKKASSSVHVKNEIKSSGGSQNSFGANCNFINSQKLSNSSFNFPSNKSISNFNSNLQERKKNNFDNVDFDDDNDDELLLAAAEVETNVDKLPSRSKVFKDFVPFIRNNNFEKNITQNKFQIKGKCSSKQSQTKVEYNSTEKGSLGSHFKSPNQVINKNIMGSDIKMTLLTGNQKSRQTSLSNFVFNKKEKPNSNVQDPFPSKDRTKNILQTKPFQYICYLNLLPRERTIYTVKGFFTTLLSKIEQNEGKWKLAAKINDGTGSCDVDIDDSVLRDLIEMSVEEFKIQKQLAMNDIQLRSTLAQRVICCQMELIRACCLLQLEVSPSLEKPKVIDLMPLSEIHLRQLKEREIL